MGKMEESTWGSTHEHDLPNRRAMASENFRSPNEADFEILTREPVDTRDLLIELEGILHCYERNRNVTCTHDPIGYGVQERTQLLIERFEELLEKHYPAPEDSPNKIKREVANVDDAELLPHTIRHIIGRIFAEHVMRKTMEISMNPLESMELIDRVAQHLGDIEDEKDVETLILHALGADLHCTIMNTDGVSKKGHHVLGEVMSLDAGQLVYPSVIDLNALAECLARDLAAILVQKQKDKVSGALMQTVNGAKTH